MTLKVAVTLFAASMVTWQLPVPLHPAPLHPANVDPPAGDAASVTALSLANSAEQVAPQLIPVGFELTAPEPVPFLLAVSCKSSGMHDG